MSAIVAAMTDTPKSPRSRRRPILAAVTILGVSISGLVLRSMFWDTPSQTPASAHWVFPEQRMVESTVSATGTVKLKTGAEVRVGAQLSGIVEKLNVSVGSRVRQDDVIAEIDSRAVTAAVAQAQAELAHDEVALVKAQLDDSRMQRLLASQAIATQQADDARATLQLAQATVASSRRALDTARVALNYVTIRAPIAGTIASVSTQQGETVTAAFATPTFVTIIADNALEVVAMVDEADIGTVHVGEPVTFTTETYPDRDFAGRVVRIAPVATIVSGVVNYEVGIAIAGDMSALKPDMTTNVSIETASQRGLFVPANAVQRGDAGKYVIVRVAGGGETRRDVLAMGRRGADVEIVRGLSPGDSVRVEDKP